MLDEWTRTTARHSPTAAAEVKGPITAFYLVDIVFDRRICTASFSEPYLLGRITDTWVIRGINNMPRARFDVWGYLSIDT
jgi:hypothetical protein